MEIIKDSHSSEGENLGSAKSYIDNFKEGTENKNKTSFLNQNSRLVKPLPSEYNKTTEKAIFEHYYERYGDSSFSDYANISDKIIKSIKRVFGKDVTSELVLNKLQEHLNSETLEEVSSTPTTKKEEVAAKELRLAEGKYDFIKGLTPLTSEQKDLCQFLDKKSICFSSDGYDLYLSLKPGKTFDNLFTFSESEEVMFQIFKDQIQDEHKARKLVLATRLVNTACQPKTSKRKTKKPKIGASV